MNKKQYVKHHILHQLIRSILLVERMRKPTPIVSHS